MPRWAAIIFWIWFLVSLTILVMRRVNKGGGDPDVADGTPARTTAGTAGTGLPGPGSTTATTAPAEKVWPAPPPPDPDDDTFRLDPAELDTTSTETSDPGAPGSGIPPMGTPPVRATLPELLAGITLPHELVPLTQVDVAIDLSTHIVVHTHKATAEAVTTSMCAELEQLGYDIERESMLKIRAAGERGRVLVEVHPDGAAVLDGTARRFPTAREGSVVVEIWAV